LLFLSASDWSSLPGLDDLRNGIVHPFQWLVDIERVIAILPKDCRPVSDAFAGASERLSAALFSGLIQSGQRSSPPWWTTFMSLGAGPVQAGESNFQRVAKSSPLSDAKEGRSRN
jgi:hypothetical protein